MRNFNLRILIVLALGVFVTGLAIGQEELPAPSGTPSPAPRPAPAPPRGFAPRRPLGDPDRAALRAQRVDRLRQLTGQALDILAPATTPGGGPVPLDIAKLNAVLGPLVSILLGGSDSVESLHIGFDPQGTNFAADRARLRADAVLKRTAWANAPSRLTGTVNAQVAESDTGRLVALVDGQLRMQTPTVALANYALAQYKARRARQGTSATGAPAPENADDDLFTQLLDEKLARVDRLESLDDAADLLTAISGLRLTAASQRIEQLRAAARAATDAEARQSLEAELARVRAERDRLFDVRPRIDRAPDGRVNRIALEMVGSELFPGAEMRAMDVQLTEGEISIQAAGALTRWVELYPIFKPIVMNVLARIQSGDPRALDGVRPLIDGVIAPGRAIIIGEP